MKRIITLLTFSPLLFLQGCGFLLVNTNKPMSICVQGTDSKTIERALNASQCTKQSKILRIKDSSLAKQEVANSTNNIVRQFQLTQYVVFDLLSPAHNLIEESVKLTVNKPFITNNSAILSSNAERLMLIDEMKNELYIKLKRYLINLK